MRWVRGVRKYILVGIILGLVALPFFWIATASFRPNSELISRARALDFDRFIVSNYQELQAAASYFTFLRNSTVVALLSTLIAVPLAMLAAFAVFRTRFRGRRAVYRLFIVTFLFPEIVLLIPLFQIFGRLGLINNLWSLIVMNVTFAAPFGVWLMRGFFGAIPPSVEEAALLDGAGTFRLLRSLSSPLRLLELRSCPFTHSYSLGRSSCSPPSSWWTSH